MISVGMAIEGDAGLELRRELCLGRPSTKSSAAWLMYRGRSGNDVRCITELSVASMKLKWILAVSFLFFVVFENRTQGEIATPLVRGDLSYNAGALLCQQEISLVGSKKEQRTDLSNSTIGSETSKLPEVYFRPGRAVPTAQGRQNLVRVLAWLQRHPNVRVVIVGYTDSQGRTVTNQILGLRRARAVETFLRGTGHILRSQIVGVESFGDSKPVCHADTEDCLARNRRVQIEVVAESKLSD